MALAQVVERWRQDRGWERKDLGRRSGIHPTMIANIENGNTPNPTARTISRLAAAFGVGEDVLLAAARAETVPPAPRPAVDLPEGLDVGWVQDFLKYGQYLTEGERDNLLALARQFAEREQAARQGPRHTKREPKAGTQAPGDEPAPNGV